MIPSQFLLLLVTIASQLILLLVTHTALHVTGDLHLTLLLQSEIHFSQPLLTAKFSKTLSSQLS